jgi:hypothetical protein
MVEYGRLLNEGTGLEPASWDHLFTGSVDL